MNLGLIGYGKMGHMVEQIAREQGHTIGAAIDIDGNDAGQALKAEKLQGIDVAIDFTVPGAVLGTVDRLSSLGISMVVGTTGWQGELEKVRAMVLERGIGFVHGSNLSIGVNLFFRLMEQAAAQLGRHPQYEPWIHEIHHSAKLDSPSGTALKLQQILQPAYPGRTLSVASNRAGSIPGEHTVGFDSEADTLTFTHTARSRRGFAAGAVHAAAWIAGKKGFYEFHETL